MSYEGFLQSFVLTDIQSTTDSESLREKTLILSDTMRPVSVLRIVCYYWQIKLSHNP